MERSLANRFELAVELAREAGAHTLKYFGTNLEVTRKADQSPVTRADREAEQLVRQRVRAAFPRDAILGEELGEWEGDSGFRWIIDPIDGTKSFISHVPLFGTLIGVEEGTESPVPRIGVIELPALNERIYAATGQGAWWQRAEQPARQAFVSSVSRLADGLVVTSDPSTFLRRGAAGLLERLAAASYFFRTWGDCYGYYLVATGRAVAMIDAMLSPWDAAAVIPVLAEAQGLFTDWTGQTTAHGGDGVGTNGRVHDELLAVLKT